MAKDIIKTKFSKHGFIASVLAFLPYLFVSIPTRYSVLQELKLIPRFLSVLYIVFSIVVILTTCFICNLSAPVYSGKSRGISISAIILGSYFIAWVYFYKGHSSLFVLSVIKLLGVAYFMVFNSDRRNWVALSFSLLLLSLCISTSVVAYMAI